MKTHKTTPSNHHLKGNTNGTAVRFGLVGLALLLGTVSAVAKPGFRANCQECHDEAFKDGMFLAGYQTSTDLGVGLKRVFQAIQGESTMITIEVTNDFNGTYGLSLLNLTAPGHDTPANQLDYTGDAAWDERNVNSVNFFTVGPNGTSPRTWTFNLGVSSNTPPDFYLVQMQMAGDDGRLWSQIEDFYIEIQSATLPPATPPLIASPSVVGEQFMLTVTTENGYTYHLDYKAELSDPSWTMDADQVSGDGGSHVLTDPSAIGPRRFYQVRVE